MENTTTPTAKVIVMDHPFILKPYTKAQLLKLYRPVSRYVLNKWLKEIESQIGPIIAGTLSIKQMEVFTKRFGIPGQPVRQAA